MISVLPLKYSESSTSYHELFFKEHFTRQKTADKPTERTLFILNIPPYATGESLKNVFSKAGNISNVIINSPYEKNPSVGFKTGFVIFEKELGLSQAMKLNKLENLSTTESPFVCGIKKWTQEYNASIYDPRKLKDDVNTFMKEFDEKNQLKKLQETQSKETDDEGWTLVTKQGRNPGFSRKKSIENKIKEKMDKDKKKKELKNFYTFQIRQSKMKHLANLRLKFEEDKKKINSLKQARKFKPY